MATADGTYGNSTESKLHGTGEKGMRGKDAHAHPEEAGGLGEGRGCTDSAEFELDEWRPALEKLLDADDSGLPKKWDSTWQ